MNFYDILLRYLFKNRALTDDDFYHETLINIYIHTYIQVSVVFTHFQWLRLQMTVYNKIHIGKVQACFFFICLPSILSFFPSFFHCRGPLLSYTALGWVKWVYRDEKEHSSSFFFTHASHTIFISPPHQLGSGLKLSVVLNSKR